LFAGACLAIVFAVLQAAVTADIGEDETFNLLINTALAGAGAVKIEYKPIVILGGICIALTAIGVIMTCCTKFTMNCICVSVNTIILFGLFITLIVFGSLLCIPGAGGAKFIDNGCKLASENRLDEINANTRPIFESMVSFDK
jgi:hypothetical protein